MSNTRHGLWVRAATAWRGGAGWGDSGSVGALVFDSRLNGSGPIRSSDPCLLIPDPFPRPARLL
jgi:hypothetical protein